VILLAALAGALTAAGLVLFLVGLSRSAPDAVAGRPPRLAFRACRLSAAAAGRGAFAVAVSLLLLMVTGWPVAALAAATAVIFLPRITGNRATKRQTAMLEGLEQWVRRLADMLTASRGLQEALEASARTAPAAVAVPVTTLARRLSARVGAEDALRAFADEIDDPAADRIAAALIIATGQRGGRVRGVLGALAEMLARDVAVRREIEADRAQHRTTLRWIIAFVGGFTVFAIVNKSYSAPYATLAGQGALAVVALIYAVGLAWLHRLGLIPGPGRFLGSPGPRLDGTDPPAANTSQAGSRHTSTSNGLTSHVITRQGKASGHARAQGAADRVAGGDR
jgi:Flp pilus assembly protein TadB